MIEVNYNDYKRILEENMRLIPENHKLKEEVERLNNIAKRLEEDLREMYLTFGEFSEEYTENKIKELKRSDKD